MVGLYGWEGNCISMCVFVFICVYVFVCACVCVCYREPQVRGLTCFPGSWAHTLRSKPCRPQVKASSSETYFRSKKTNTPQQLSDLACMQGLPLNKTIVTIGFNDVLLFTKALNVSFRRTEGSVEPSTSYFCFSLFYSAWAHASLRGRDAWSYQLHRTTLFHLSTSSW